MGMKAIKQLQPMITNDINTTYSIVHEKQFFINRKSNQLWPKKHEFLLSIDIRILDINIFSHQPRLEQSLLFNADSIDSLVRSLSLLAPNSLFAYSHILPHHLDPPSLVFYDSVFFFVWASRCIFFWSFVFVFSLIVEKYCFYLLSLTHIDSFIKNDLFYHYL